MVFERGWRLLLAIAATMLAALASPAMANVSAEFTTGAIAQYANNGNINSNAKSFATLGISKIVMSQAGSSWGGTQGNDTAVTLTIHFTDTLKAPVSFSGALNWLKNDGGNAIPVDYFGVTTGTVVPDATDGYVRTSTSLFKTYILALPSKVASSGFNTLVSTDSVTGSANMNNSNIAAIFSAITADTLLTTSVDSPALISGPSGSAGDATSAISINENLTAVTTFTTNETGVTWSLDGGADAAKFTIDPATGALVFQSAPDFEAPSDTGTNNTYEVVIKVVDSGGNISRQTLTVTILNVDEPALIQGPSGAPGDLNSAIAVNEGVQTVTQFAANEPVTWSIDGGVDASLFTIAPDGTISFNITTDYGLPDDTDANNIYIVRVKAVDSGNNVSYQTLTVTVLDLNNPPPVITGPTGSAPGAASSAISVNEGLTDPVTTFTANETGVTWSLDAGVDKALFTIDPNTGALSFITPPDFAAPADSNGDNQYVVVVKVTDSQGAPAYQTLTVTVLDITPPAIILPTGVDPTAAEITINEGLTAVATLGTNDMGTVEWFIDGGVDKAQFTIDKTTGALTFVTAPDYQQPVDADGNNKYIVRIGIKDAAGNISYQDLTVTVLDTTAPAIILPAGVDPAAAEITINEGIKAVATLGTDDTGTVEWFIDGGVDAAQFTIDKTTGALTFVTAPDYQQPADADGNNKYIVRIGIKDAAGNISYQDLTVTVLDTTAPTIILPAGVNPTAAEITINEGLTAVATLGTDDTGTVEWFIDSGVDAAQFAIDKTTGALTFVSAPDYEQPADADKNNTYLLRIGVKDSSGNTRYQNLTVNVLDVDDTPPAIILPAGINASNALITINEGLKAVATLGTDDTGSVTWSIDGGVDAAKFAIDKNTGALTFVTAPDFEQPVDTDGNNEYLVRVKLEDLSGNISYQILTVKVLNVDDAAPLIQGPSGTAGALESAISINEGLTAVTTFAANEPVKWAIDGGDDALKFAVDANTGALIFLAAPDYETPLDKDGNNTYIVRLKATDSANNVSYQTLTVTILNLDDTPALIKGPSGKAGDATSAITIKEGLTAVTAFTANETVKWSLDGGDDAGKFRINADTGALVFVAAPDFENPTDVGANNTYVVRIKATDAFGNVSYQTLTVTIDNVGEIDRKLAEIGQKLRNSLRNYAAHGLSDMLSFNEGLMRGQNDGCQAAPKGKGLSGSANATEAGGKVDLNYSNRVSDCGRRYQVFADAGLAYSKMAGNWNSRAFAALRLESKLDKDLLIGLGVLGSHSSDQMIGFEQSSISDKSLQANLYTRYRLSNALRTAAFAGIGRSWYDFGLTDTDGFTASGKMTGKRVVYGWMLSGDLTVGGTVLTTDAVVSRAVEKLGSATLAARHLGENRSNIAFAVGTVDVTRISVPISAPITLSGNEGQGAFSRILLSPGLLCEDTNVDQSALSCGYQVGAKYVANDGGRNRFYADYRWESVAGVRRSLLGLGYSYLFGKNDGLELGLEVNRGMGGRTGQDNRALLSLKVAR